MSKSDGSGPTIQVLARAYALLDVLAAHTDPVPLKELSARTGLHPSTAHRILNDLAVTQVIASHDLELILETCSRALVIDHGRLVADGPARRMLADAALMDAHGLEVPHSLR